MFEVALYLEVAGIAIDENGNPAPAGLKITVGEAQEPTLRRRNKKKGTEDRTMLFDDLRELNAYRATQLTPAGVKMRMEELDRVNRRLCDARIEGHEMQQKIAMLELRIACLQRENEQLRRRQECAECRSKAPKYYLVETDDGRGHGCGYKRQQVVILRGGK